MRRVIHLLGEVQRDATYAWRQLRRTPVFAVVTVTTLALGVGANTALFSLLNGLVIRTLPVRAPDRLTVLTGGIPTYPFVPQLPGYTYPIWKAVEERAPAFDGVAAWTPIRLDLSGRGEAEPADGLLVSGSFFTTVGVTPAIGRALSAGDDVAGGMRAAVISDTLWRHRFASNPAIVGEALTIERTPFTIVGVMPHGFDGPEVGRAFDVYIPISAAPTIGRGDYLTAWIFRIFVRLKPNQSREAATAALRTVQPQLRRSGPADAPASLDVLESPLTLVSGRTGTSGLRRVYGRPLTILLGIVALVLLVACANLAHLHLVRTLERRREFSLRLALGAPRGSIVRQLLVESLMLSGAGGVAALLFTHWISRTLIAQLSSAVTHVALDVPIDDRVLVFCVAVATASALCFGLAPAVFAARRSPTEAARPQTHGDSHSRSFAVLLVGQVAVSLVLLAVTGLLLGSFVRLTSTPRGFDADRVLLVNVGMTHAHVHASGRLPLFTQLIDDISALPGVTAVGGSTLTPVSGVSVIRYVNRAGGSVSPDSAHAATANSITPGWISAYGLRLLDGRDFTGPEAVNRSHGIIVNEAFAQKFLNGRRAVGSTIVNRDGSSDTIVGLVSDAIYTSVRDPRPPTVFAPLTQDDAPLSLTINVRVNAGSPGQMVAPISRLIAKRNSALTFAFRELDEQINASIAQDRIVALLASFFGGLALTLTVVGVYGSTAYGLVRRRKELAIRVALGATLDDLCRLVLGEMGRRLIVGVAAGLVTTWWAVRAVQSMLFRTESHDPLTLFGATAVLTIVGGLAAWVPTRRASRLDPADVLRES